MGRLIDADVLREEWTIASPEPFNTDSAEVIASIDNAPTVDAKPVVHGKWIIEIHGKPESGGTLGKFICNQCGKAAWATATNGELNYCPNCGADTREREKHE